MARFNSSFLLMMVFLVACSGLLVSSGLSSEYPPKPSADWIQHLEKCGSRLTPKCREELSGFIVFGKATVTEECCDQLVNNLGQRCHFDLMKSLVLNPNFKSTISEIFERGEQIWEKCALAAKSPSPSS
ncbi:hypothetical protein L6164_001056 [Bauhinia variegata]|uniref:Uncharacterized protein n=1 Tax=Bauhinia variegata TaxID=167791 RepID=A0ACB9Q7Y3_BAUVA|nr:hypothetical protein L6164_001056 [Bauhinia variegata]